MTPELTRLRRELREAEHERRGLIARIQAAEQRAERAEHSAKEAWAFAKLMAHTTSANRKGVSKVVRP